MSESELHELRLTILDSISNVWELWIVVTFALIVAVYFGRSILTKPLVITVTTLYLAMTVVLTMRYLGYGSMGEDLVKRMSEAGVVPLYHPLGPSIFLVSLLILVIGSIGAISFALLHGRDSDAQ